LRLLFVGLEDRLRETLDSARPGWSSLPVKIVRADAVDEMGETKFSFARKKALQKESSIRRCLEAVKAGEADAALSAGSTAASVFWGLEVFGPYPGPHDRPAIPVPWPHSKGFTVLIDAGAIVDASAETLAHAASLGFLYAKHALGRASPTVGLLSIGEERSKGNAAVKEAYGLIQKRLGSQFLGMVEGRDLAMGKVDVVACDGFIGNIALKLGEGMIHELANLLKANLNWMGKVGALLMLPSLKRIKRRLSWETYGAMPLLGVNGGLFIAHGRSTPLAVSNGLARAADFARKRALDDMRRASPVETPASSG
jgi:glycerol-3-phosphate acyltransferase PlsX